MKAAIREQDRPILKGILRHGSRIGDSAKELADAIGCTTQLLIAVAKRYDGRRFKGGTIHYTGPQRFNMSKSCPGIANPRSGYARRCQPPSQ